MITSIYKDSVYITNNKKELYNYNIKTKQLKKIENNNNKDIEIFIEICSLLYRNTILNKFKKKGIDFRTNNFYETVCDVLFEYEEDSEEYQLLNKFIILAADYQIT